MTQRPREPVMTQPTHDLALAELDRHLRSEGIWG
jgi:hypothetical protein